MVLDITPRSTNALFLGVDADHNLTLEKFLEDINLKKFLQSPFRRVTQKSWEGNYLFNRLRRKIIVTTDPTVATTISIPLDLSRERDRAKEEITLEELENLIAQAMSKVFTQCRSEAAKRVGVDDIHTILVGAKTGRFKVDGHTVMNPIGFTGKKISLLLDLTFTGRELFETLRQFFNSPDEFFFVEAPQALVHSVARVRDLPLNVIAPDGVAGSAALFTLKKADAGQPVLHRERISWSSGAASRKIADELEVSRDIAKDIYAKYRSGQLSTAAERALARILQPVGQEILDTVANAKLNGFVYLDMPEPAPFNLPKKSKGVTFESIPADEVLGELGLQLNIAGDHTLQQTFRNLAPFLESYFAKNTSEINQKLRRRLHWLAE